VIIAHNITKTFVTKKVLDDVSFLIPKGSITGLIGRNGAGKTTLLGILCGLIRPDIGSIQVGGVDLFKDMTRARKMIGYVPQKTSLYPELTGRQNLIYFGMIRGLGGKQLTRAIQEAVVTTSLVNVLDIRVSHYSGGMQKRLNLAIGLLGNPPILYMDEPTVGVDRESRDIILETLMKMSRERETTVLYTSHYFQEIEKICDRLIILEKGIMIANDVSKNLLLNSKGLENYLEVNTQV
jgi:ABC-2 type transport system ATP-binding protein